MYLLYPDNQVTLINGTKPGLWSYLWDYGDGRTDTIRDPLAPHTYNPWGVYYITLKVWNSHCSDAIQHRLTIRPPVPISDFDAGDNGCVPLPMAFTNHSIWVTSWHWDFGNGAVSTDSVGSTIYEEPGIYQVKLTVTGDGGEVSSSRTIEVYPKPEVNFELRPSLVMLPDATVKFYNTSKYGSRFLWDFGDSTQSADIEPSHTYHALGEYTVRLNVWTINNCFDSLVKSKVVEVIGSGVIKFPNAFTPNINGQGDGKYTTPDLLNEVFHPYWEGVIDYHLEIYDRWGEKLFETHDINTGWDGYYKGKLCKTDVYVWKAKGKFSNDKTFDIAGNVTLIR